MADRPGVLAPVRSLRPVAARSSLTHQEPRTVDWTAEQLAGLLRNTPLRPWIGAHRHILITLGQVFQLLAGASGGKGSGGRAKSRTARRLATTATTAEESFSQCLAANAAVTLDHVMGATGLSVRQIWKTQAWKQHEQRLLGDYLAKHVTASTADVKRDLGFSPAKTVGMAAWREHHDRRKAAQPPGRLKERPLTAATLACRADGTSVDVAARVANRDQVLRVLVERGDPDTRARLHPLTPADREALVDYVLLNMDDETASGRSSTETCALLVATAQSWLDENEQHKRHENRAAKRCLS